MSESQGVRLLPLQQSGDSRGMLVIAEENREIPFEIKRIFFMYGSSGDVVRGKHANRVSQFVLICVHGSCDVKVIGPGGSEAEYRLDDPNVGLYLPAMVWKDMYHFSEDCVLLALSSAVYDAQEYIRDFDAFLAGD